MSTTCRAGRRFYRDDRHVRAADMPVRLSLGPAGMEVAASRRGTQRIHLISTAEDRRSRPSPHGA